ncbi:MAG: DNA-directed RNA polymerase subunit omega [Balneolaceae bacterium]
MPIKTLDVEKLGEENNNKYEILVVMAKRARQIAAQEKLELDEKLKYFEGFEDEDEFTFNEEQERISRAFEQLPHTTQRSVEEMLEDKIYFDYPNKEE